MRLLDGHHRHIIISHGDLSIQKGIQRVGINSLIYWLKEIKYGLKILLPLVVLISRRNFEFNEQPSITHQLDAGAAWENLALEASTRGIVTHGMQGFDYQRAKSELGIPETYDVMSMIAIGKMAPKESLPSNLQERESPSDRKPLTEIVMKGYYREGIKK